MGRYERTGRVAENQRDSVIDPFDERGVRAMSEIFWRNGIAYTVCKCGAIIKVNQFIHICYAYRNPK